jgi:hypothetical protein
VLTEFRILDKKFVFILLFCGVIVGLLVGLIDYQLIDKSSETSDSENLVHFPSSWTTTVSGMHYAIGGTENVVLDTSVTYNGQSSLRIDLVGSTDNYAREADGPYLAVKPGDHITFSCWIKTSASTLNDTGLEAGGRIGIDFYGENGRICGSQCPNGHPGWTFERGWDLDVYLNFVQWGTSTWTRITMNFTVPPTYEADQISTYSAGSSVEPVGIIPWFQVLNTANYANDDGQAWFADPELYIS